MKKTALLLVIAMLLVSLFVSCGDSTTAAEPTTETPTAATSAVETPTFVPVTELPTVPEPVGEYTFNTAVAGKIPANAMTAFSEAFADPVTGATVEPLACFACQSVSGMNYAFIVKNTPVVPDADSSLGVLIVYKPLEGSASVLTSAAFDINNYLKNTSAPTVQTAGGWQVPAGGGMEIMPNPVATAVSGAFAKYEGMTFLPLALLGSQVVSGMNYALVCTGTTVTEAPETGVFVVEIYVDNENNVSVSSIAALDVNTFLEE